MRIATTDKNQKPHGGESESRPDVEKGEIEEKREALYLVTIYNGHARRGGYAIADIGPLPLREAKFEAAHQEIRGRYAEIEGRPGIVRNPRKNLLVDCYDTENQLS